MTAELVEKLDALRASLAAFDVTLPLVASEKDIGSVQDASGNEVFVVDLNREWTDADAHAITKLIVNTINACAGFIPSVPYKVEQHRIA